MIPPHQMPSALSGGFGFGEGLAICEGSTVLINSLEFTRIDFDNYQNCTNVLHKSYRMFTCCNEIN